MEYSIIDSPSRKVVRSPLYNYNFCKKTGFFARWGKTKDDDPKFSPFSPEILDIEISVNGCPNGDICPMCYKDNSSQPATNMILETFTSIINKFPHKIEKVS